MLSLLLKIFAIAVGLLAVGKTLIDFRKKEETLAVALFWLLLWIALIVIAINPALIDSTIEALSGRRGTVGQIVGVGFIFIIYILYRIYLKVQRNEQKITRLVRRLALHETAIKKKK